MNSQTILHQYQTGWFGVPGWEGGKVHIVEDGRPVCGTPLPQGSEFQFCAQGVEHTYVECQRCKTWNMKRRVAAMRPSEVIQMAALLAASPSTAHNDYLDALQRRRRALEAKKKTDPHKKRKRAQQKASRRRNRRK